MRNAKCNLSLNEPAHKLALVPKETKETFILPSIRSKRVAMLTIGLVPALLVPRVALTTSLDSTPILKETNLNKFGPKSRRLYKDYQMFS